MFVSERGWSLLIKPWFWFTQDQNDDGCMHYFRYPGSNLVIDISKYHDEITGQIRPDYMISTVQLRGPTRTVRVSPILIIKGLRVDRS